MFETTPVSSEPMETSSQAESMDASDAEPSSEPVSDENEPFPTDTSNIASEISSEPMSESDSEIVFESTEPSSLTEYPISPSEPSEIILPADTTEAYVYTYGETSEAAEPMD